MWKITIVDGDESNIASIKTILAGNNYALSFLSTAEELMSGLSRKQSDMIIINIDLEGATDGRELSRVLQTETVYKNIPVILTSPYFHTESDVRGFFCDDIVSVPFDASLLSTTVEALLAKDKARIARLEKMN